MGGFFSWSKVDSNRRIDGAAASSATGASDEPVGTGLTEPSMSTREDSMCSLSCVADSASSSGFEGMRPAEVAQS